MKPQEDKLVTLLVRGMTSDDIRRELENLQGLILDCDDRMDWSILNAELLARNESVVEWVNQ